VYKSVRYAETDARAPACDALVEAARAMVGVGVAEGGGAPDGCYGEYYPPEQYFVPPDMCPHPQQHPQHPHMCAVLNAEYGK
jgi:hypothetical protein